MSSGLVEFLAQFGAFTCVATLGTVYGEILSNLRVHGAKDTKDMPREAMTVLYSRRHEGRDGGPTVGRVVVATLPMECYFFARSFALACFSFQNCFRSSFTVFSSAGKSTRTTSLVSVSSLDAPWKQL